MELNGLGQPLKFIGRIKIQEAGYSMMLCYRMMPIDNAFSLPGQSLDHYFVKSKEALLMYPIIISKICSFNPFILYFQLINQDQ
jgi:hypothetical protein